MAEPTVAAVLIFHKNDATFPAALDSVLRQTRRPDRVIVVDDATPAGQATTLKDLPPEVVLVRRTTNGGSAVARQTGSDTQEAQGCEWLAYLDGDDFWVPEKLERQLAFLAQYPEVNVSHCGAVAFYGKGRPDRVFIDKPALLTLDEVVVRGHVLSSALILRREALARVGGWTTSPWMTADWELSIRLAAAGEQIRFQPEPLMRFRREGQGNVTSDPWRDHLRHLLVIEEHKSLITRALGVDGVRQLRARRLRKLGRSVGGVRGRALRVAGWILGHRFAP
jgi:GT2 family glycosyltransferase